VHALRAVRVGGDRVRVERGDELLARVAQPRGEARAHPLAHQPVELARREVRRGAIARAVRRGDAGDDVEQRARTRRVPRVGAAGESLVPAPRAAPQRGLRVTREGRAVRLDDVRSARGGDGRGRAQVSVAHVERRHHGRTREHRGIVRGSHGMNGV
jgi:hypothetical protein